MPYIKQEFRKKLEVKLQSLVDEIVDIIRMETTFALPGILNYLITCLITRSYKQSIEMETEEPAQLSYHDYNDAVGVLECCKMELYRRQAAPYEDIKIEQNGDV